MVRIDKDTPAETQAFEDVLVQCIGDFLRWCVGKDIPIIKGWVNGVARPSEPYAMITPLGLSINATTCREYSPDEEDESKGTVTVSQSTSQKVQVDLFGAPAETWARTCAYLFADMTGANFLAQTEITPLTVSVPQNLTFINGAEQAEPRWMLELDVQLSPAFASTKVALDFFNSVQVLPRDCEAEG